MSNQSEAKETASEEAVGKHRGKLPEQWKLRVTRKMRESAQGFRSALLRIEAVEEGEFPEPPVTTQLVRLVFHSSLEGSRAAELIQIIGAGSEENIAADAMRFRKLVERLKSLKKEVAANQKEIAATEMSARLQWDDLLRQIQVAQTETRDFGEPPYHNPDAVAAGSLPDFMSIWPKRAKYTARLAELETTARTLGNDLKRQRQPAEAGIAAIRGPTPRPIELPSMEAEVGVRELLGGPLCRLVAIIGKADPQATSLSQATSIPLSESWWELVKAYHELHLESGLLETSLVPNPKAEVKRPVGYAAYRSEKGAQLRAGVHAPLLPSRLRGERRAPPAVGLSPAVSEAGLIGIGEPEDDRHWNATLLLQRAYSSLLEFVKLVVSAEKEKRKINEASSVSARSAGESTASPQPTQVAPAAQAAPPTTQDERLPPQTEPRPNQQVAPSNEHDKPPVPLHPEKFLKTACEVDSPPAVVEPVPKAKEARVKKRKAKPTGSTNEMPTRKPVTVRRTAKEGSELKVQVDGVEVGDEASTVKKVLLAACILHLRSRNYDWWQTKDLMDLALTKDELKGQGKARAKDLGNWQGALLASPHRLNLEKQQAGRRFRLTGIKFKTSLKESEIQSALQQFSKENPIKRRKRDKRS